MGRLTFLNTTKVRKPHDFYCIVPRLLEQSRIDGVKVKFEKVKTQNKLRPEHIEKIVSTYRERKEIERYSHLATLDEVRENDYNLNIPRYVDTFEEEEPIDIQAVMADIKRLEAERSELDKEIEVYLKELGIVQ